MSSGQELSTLISAAVIIWGIAILLSASIGFAGVLAMTADEPNWTDITLAVATVGLTLATIGLAVAAFMALGALGESRRDRNALVMNDLSARWDNDHFRKVRYKIHEYAGSGTDSRDKLRDKIVQFREGNHEEYLLLLTEPGFLEDLAISIKHGGVYDRIVNDSLGYIIWDRWCLWQPTILELRRIRNEQSVYEHFERMAATMHRENPNLETFEAWTGPKY